VTLEALVPLALGVPPIGKEPDAVVAFASSCECDLHRSGIRLARLVADAKHVRSDASIRIARGF